MAKKKKPAKAKVVRVDGELHPKDIERLRNAIREVWMWTSVARRICLKRATNAKGFGVCESCKSVVPKVYADHIEVMGHPLKPKFIERMWCHSSKLQALCKKCHDEKTKEERGFVAWKRF